MGWTSFPINSDDKTSNILGKELTQQYIGGEQSGFDIIESYDDGDAFFTIVEVTNKDTQEKKMFCGITLVDRKGEMFAYKDMSEDMGPCALCKSPSFMSKLKELIPNPPSDFAKRWRNDCWELIAEK